MSAKPTLTPQEFSAKWASSRLKERAGSQEHFIDVCRLVGHPTPAEADPEGKFFTFERAVSKVGGEVSGSEEGGGSADVWYRGRFAWEYKGKHKDLGAAYRQLQLYRIDLENPPLLVVSDMDRFEVHTNFNRTVEKVYSFTNEEIGSSENEEALRLLEALFRDPDSLRPGKTREAVTEEVAAKFARLADGLRSRGEEPHRVAHFLMKLVFCLFAEDVELLPGKMFTRLVEASAGSPERFPARARELFRAMAEGGEVNWTPIRHFNGGLFANDDALELTRDEVRVLVEAARQDWSSVEPAIFGTLFERSLDPRKRAQLGTQYTGKDDILRIVEPVLMAPLRREWEGVRGEVEDLMATEHPKSPQSARTRSVNRVLREAQAKLDAFAQKVRSTRVLDPACGSGNFLYVALNELLDLEKEVSVAAGKTGLGPFFPEVSPEHLFGMEVDPYARELAQVSVWIGYLQWMNRNGFGSPGDPVLGPMTNIVERDAVVARGEGGEPVEPEWPEADAIVGNPPFLGDRRMRTELGHEYVEDLRRLYEGRIPGGADLVCYWFERARGMIAAGRARRAGLLATNSIRGGANRRVLERIGQTGGIFFAESDRPWTLEGAAVRVSMVGFDGGEEKAKVLDGAPVANINPDLTGDLDLTTAAKLSENAGVAFYGTVKIGPFDLKEAVAEEMLAAVGNPNGRPNEDVVKPWANAMDVTRRPRHMWAIDFGVDMPLEEAALYEKPFEYVRTHVKPMRDGVRRKKYREVWWLFGEPGAGLRRALAPLDRYIATPTVAKHRLFVWLERPTIPDHQLTVFARSDDYFFGVLHSRVHELWALRMGTWMGVGNDLRYTPTSTFATFPFPWPPGEEPEGDPRVEAVAAAARRLDRLRRNWMEPQGIDEVELKKRTLTNLYNSRPTWLASAHTVLDRAVFAAYGWTEDPEEMSEEEMLGRLLDLNVRRSGSPTR